MASVMTEVVTAAAPGGCALCGLPKMGHGIRWGLAHLDEPANERPLTYVAPSEDLTARRLAARASLGYAIADFHPNTGEPTTDLLRTRCACGATALATPERVATARCGSCMWEAVQS